MCASSGASGKDARAETGEEKSEDAAEVAADVAADHAAAECASGWRAFGDSGAIGSRGGLTAASAPSAETGTDTGTGAGTGCDCGSGDSRALELGSFDWAGRYGLLERTVGDDAGGANTYGGVRGRWKEARARGVFTAAPAGRRGVRRGDAADGASAPAEATCACCTCACA